MSADSDGKNGPGGTVDFTLAHAVVVDNPHRLGRVPQGNADVPVVVAAGAQRRTGAVAAPLDAHIEVARLQVRR